MGKVTAPEPKRALVLMGGGARAAYQVGVLKALVELLPKNTPNPFPVITGTSAGAINAVAIAVYGARLQEAVARLHRIWHNFRVYHVFKADVWGITVSGFHWIISVLLVGLGKYNPVCFLDRAPLRKLLQRYLPCENIQKSLDEGILESLCISASSYTTGRSVVFYHSKYTVVPWNRARRVGVPEHITLDHLMASSAIPFVFSAVKLGQDYYGDGSMRQTAPISPAIHMGANKVLVIEVSAEPKSYGVPDHAQGYPTLAQVGGHILNSIFIDGLESDLERLRRINKTLDIIPSHHLVEHNISLRHVDVLVVSPSQDLQEISMRHVQALPRIVRFLLKGIGALDSKGSSLVSYLLFEKSFCREVIALGYEDAMARKEELLNFLS